MIIRWAAEQEWPLIYPFYAAIMAEGKTYAFPEGQSLDEARPWWMEEPPGQTVVAVSDGVIVGSAKTGLTGPAAGRTWRQRLGFQIIGTAPASFDHPEHGLVGLHIMFRHL